MIYMCVCIYVYACACICVSCVCIYVYMYICMHYVCKYVCAFMRVCMCVVIVFLCMCDTFFTAYVSSSLARCSLSDMRLCTPDELSVTCKQGCGYDKQVT